jgi:hypothetical protein
MMAAPTDSYTVGAWRLRVQANRPARRRWALYRAGRRDRICWSPSTQAARRGEIVRWIDARREAGDPPAAEILAALLERARCARALEAAGTHLSLLAEHLGAASPEAAAEEARDWTADDWLVWSDWLEERYPRALAAGASHPRPWNAVALYQALRLILREAP